MKARILLLAAGIATLTSCSSLYKTGQTPDDVYYSPARPVAEYVQNERNDRYDGYQSYQEYQDNYRNDRFLRLSMGNPYYMSVYSDYGGFDWRANAYASYWNSPWNNYWAWNNFYNPYAYSYCSVPIGYGGGYYSGYSKISFNGPISKPVAFSGRSYSNRSTNTRYVSGPNGAYYNQGSQQRYNNSNNSNSGNSLYNNNSSNSNSGNHNNTPSTPSRSYTPSSSSSSSSSGGGGGGGISRPTRN